MLITCYLRFHHGAIAVATVPDACWSTVVHQLLFETRKLGQVSSKPIVVLFFVRSFIVITFLFETIQNAKGFVSEWVSITK